MKTRQSEEFQDFDRIMDGLLAVPYVELRRKLDEEKGEKLKQRKKRAISPASSRASSSRKRRVA